MHNDLQIWLCDKGIVQIILGKTKIVRDRSSHDQGMRLALKSLKTARKSVWDAGQLETRLPIPEHHGQW